MKYLIFVFFISYVFAFNLQNECPYEIKQYPNAKNYTLRLESYFDNYGCDLLPLYNTLDKVDNEQMLDYIDNHSQILPDLIKLSKQYPKFLILLANNEEFINFLKQTQYDSSFFNNILYLLKFVNFQQLYKNKNYLKVIYFAAYNEDSTNEAYKSLLKLKKIPYEFINNLAISYWIIKKQFPDIKKQTIINDFIKLKYKLSYEELRLLCKYNPTYLITFLYNTKYVNHFNNYQQEMIYIYKQLFHKYRYSNNIILKLTFSIAPFLIAQNINFTPSFKILFKDLINNDLLAVLIENESNTIDPCSKENYFGIFANNNLQKLTRFISQNKELYKKYIQDISTFQGDAKYKIFNLIILSDLFNKYYPSNKWEMIKGILKSNLFPKEYKNLVEKMNIIVKLENIQYFDILSSRNDWKDSVKAESEDMKSINAPKYLYILFTSIGMQNNSPALLYILFKNPKTAKQKLKILANYSVEELSEHRFTREEKTGYYIDLADNIATGLSFVVAIVLAPETGGTSLVVLSTAKATITKAGEKVIKKVGLDGIKKQSKKYFAKKTLKYYFKNKLSNKYKRKISDNLDKMSNKAEALNIGFSAALPFFLKDVKFNQVCKGK